MKTHPTTRSTSAAAAFTRASGWIREPAVLRHPDPEAERRFWRSAADGADPGSPASPPPRGAWTSVALQAV